MYLTYYVHLVGIKKEIDSKNARRLKLQNNPIYFYDKLTNVYL
jgi:hypothetical protein